jgi:transposase
MKKRRTHQPDFKARIALEAIKGLKPVSEIAKTHTIHPVQVSEWKKTLTDRAPELFGKALQNDSGCLAQELERAQSKIGQLSLDLDYLKKKSAQLGLIIEPDALKSRSLA